MAGGDLGEDDGITGINVTPLVDVMLVLLIIFMVTANYIANQAISLQLPKAATGADPGPVAIGDLAADKKIDRCRCDRRTPPGTGQGKIGVWRDGFSGCQTGHQGARRAGRF